MPVIELSIVIRAPRERVFDLARSIDAHQDTTGGTEERAAAGIGQWTALTGSAVPAPRSIYIAKNDERCLRRGDWKLIQPANQAPLELFNLAADPFEKNDLAATEPARVKELLVLLEAEAALDNPRLPADLVGLPR